MGTPAQFPGVCGECGRRFDVGTMIDSYNGVWCHETCPSEEEDWDPTLDGKYNALTQKVDRIMTGDQRLRVSGGATFMAETEKFESRTDIRFDHKQIASWANDGRDRTALTLALNLHELGHVFFTPAREKYLSPEQLRAIAHLNQLEDQRQELLTSLRFPKAVDYFRFINARALGRNAKRIDGRYFMLYYGRRHLFPTRVNAALRALAVTRYGEQGTQTIERLITEYQLLNLPEDRARGWEIAMELFQFDHVDDIVDDDLRHDCLPEKGSPTVRPKEKQLLAQRLKKLLGTPPKGQAGEPGDTVAVVEQPKAAPEQERADLPQSSPTDPGTGEPGDAGERAAEPAEAPQTENAPKEPAEDEIGGPTESEETQGEPGAGAGTSGGEEPNADGEDETGLDEDADDESEGDDEEADSDAQAVGDADLGEGEDEPQAERPKAGRGGKRGGAHGTGTLPDPGDMGDLGQMLEVMEDNAIDNVGDDLDAKHQALKATDVPVNMGGKARGALDGEWASSARQLAALFREINQDLKPTVHRNLKRGRLDARRVSVAVANNSPRMFKRRQADLSADTAMAVHIMIDVSSSMMMQMHRAIGAGFALARGVELAGHIAKVTTYDTHHKVQKNWLDKQYGMRVQHGGGGTSPHLMLRLAQADFRQVAMHEEIHNHVAIIVTDGAWSGPDACQRAIDALVKDDVHVILIGIGMVPEGYERVTVLTTQDVQGLAAAMTQPLRKLAVEIARGVRKKVSV